MKKLLSSVSPLSRRLPAFVVLLCGLWAAVATQATAQSTVQVGTGTGNTIYGPIYIYSATSTSKYSYSMTIYSQADILAAGGAAGLIDRISWNKINTGAYTTNDATFEIFMKHTTDATVTSAVFSTEQPIATQVFNSTTASLPATAGWVDFNLSTPFTWNGADNLMVLTRWSRPGNGTGEVKWESSTANASIKMSFSSTGTFTTSYTYANRPNIKLRISAVAGVADAANVLNLAVYPNPAREAFYLDFGLRKTGAPVTVTVSDLTGKTVMQDSFNATAVQVSRRYDPAGLKAGIYLVQVKTPEGISVKKLLWE